ncbi:uncharacterized protein CcaverHIS019_0308530 [Cutaneotrichosporon cavernicola]|uniref:Uncharacterized protein n=1 Tax=Cutaneotrichosporon cavernicola TaxID=279322 RepID=A0AA48IJ32_9TREE|nr:uncharacterized protein CcaverHIS019_0308530 [Cutaneotrichosporon cavernicola]BEI90783.1 hypothetical protein CcaverHIS019_0308530 [Cutaneotrichosporon cavernicola]
MTQDTFPLPDFIHTSPPSLGGSNPTFPRLKVRCAPRVILPTHIAPDKPKPEALEKTIKVVAQLGAKIVISWSVDAASLEEADTLPEGAQLALEDRIGGWILNTRGKRKADELDGDDNHDDAAASDDNGRSKLCQPLGLSQEGSSIQQTVKTITLDQIATMMPEILRRQMIRRFPYVFDGPFLGYRKHLHLPPAFLTAMSGFAFNAARHRPEFLVKCGGIIGKMEESRREQVQGQIKAVAFLPAQQKPGRRKTDSQGEAQSQDDRQASRERIQEDASYARAADAIEAAANADAHLVARQRLHRLIAEKVAAVGTTKWLDVRRKRGRMGASRVVVDAPAVDYSQGPPVEVGKLLQERQFASSLDESHLQHCFPHHLLGGSQHHHFNLPHRAWDDDYDNLDDEADYVEDDYVGCGYAEGDGDIYDDDYVGYNNNGVYDDLADDLGDEKFGTPHLSLHHLSHGLELRSPHHRQWCGRDPSPSPLAGFDSLQLSDIPIIKPSFQRRAGLIYSDEGLDDVLGRPLADDFEIDLDDYLQDNLNDNLENRLAGNLDVRFGNVLKGSIMDGEDDLEGPDTLDAGFGKTRGVGYDSDLDKDDSSHPKGHVKLPPDGTVGGNLDDSLPDDGHEVPVRDLDDGFREDTDERLSSKRQDGFCLGPAVFIGDVLRLDGDEIDNHDDLDDLDDLDDVVEAYCDDHYRHADEPERPEAHVAKHPPEDSFMHSPFSRWDDGNHEDEPMGVDDLPGNADSPIAIDYQPSLPGFDGDREPAFNYDDSLDGDGLEDLPKPMSCSNASIQDHLSMDDVDHAQVADQYGREMDLLQNLTPDLRLTGTQNMSISQHSHNDERMLLKEREREPAKLDQADWDVDLDVDNWGEMPERALHCHEMYAVDDDLGEEASINTGAVARTCTASMRKGIATRSNDTASTRTTMDIDIKKKGTTILGRTAGLGWRPTIGVAT